MSDWHWKDPRFQVKSDPFRRAQRRLLQGWWRATQLGLPAGRDEFGLRNNMAQVSSRGRPVIELSLSRGRSLCRAAGWIVLLRKDTDQDRPGEICCLRCRLFQLLVLRANPDAAAQVLALVTELDVAEVDEIEVSGHPRPRPTRR